MSKLFRLATRQGVVVIAPDFDVLVSLPKVPTIELFGEPALIVPHELRETVILRRLGYDVPSPILRQYPFPSPPGEKAFDAQLQTAAMLSLNPRAYVLSEMGVGKTRAVLWAWDYMRLHNPPLAKRLLVVAPLSTLRFTWAREVQAIFPHLTVTVLHGTRAQRLKKLNDTADIYVVNHDGVKTIREQLMKRSDIDSIVLDELAVYRNNSARSKEMRKLVATGKFRNVWGVTGAPIPNAPTDVWAEAQIVTPERVPKYFVRLRDEMMLKVNEFKWVPKTSARERAFSILQPAVRFTLDDVIELPVLIERFVDIDQTPVQEKIYKEILAFCFSRVEAGEITAANAGAAMSKLLQISIGYVYTREKGVATLPNNTRIEALLDAVNSTERKVLVFAAFKHALTGISAALANENIEHAVMSGDTPANARSDIFTAFQTTGRYKVLVAHPQCLAHGITLTAADTIIWFGPITSLETYEQANQRIRRVGQTHKQLILNFQGTSVEKHVYKLLRNKQNVQTGLLDMFSAATSKTLTAPLERAIA